MGHDTCRTRFTLVATFTSPRFCWLLGRFPGTCHDSHDSTISFSSPHVAVFEIRRFHPTITRRFPVRRPSEPVRFAPPGPRPALPEGPRWVAKETEHKACCVKRAAFERTDTRETREKDLPQPIGPKNNMLSWGDEKAETKSRRWLWQPGLAVDEKVKNSFLEICTESWTHDFARHDFHSRKWKNGPSESLEDQFPQKKQRKFT